MKRSESAFLKWFTAQFGQREKGGPGPDSALVSMVQAGNNAERMLRERANWDANHKAALLAWTARDKPKPRKRGKAVNG